MDFRVNVKSTVRLRMPGFSDEQMERFGELAIEQQTERVLAGINVHDQPARALAPGYRKQKQRRGLPGVRNMRLTGALLESLHVTTVGDGRVRAGFTPEQGIKAHVAQEKEKMFGLSPSDKRAVIKEMRAEFAEGFRRA